MNEWVEIDSIVLEKLIQDICKAVDNEDVAKRSSQLAVERALALWKENNEPTTSDASEARAGISGLQKQHDNVTIADAGVGGSSSSGHSRVASGDMNMNPTSSNGEKRSKEERVDANCSVRDLRSRIRAMKEWRREIERTVCWQREEYRRVMKAIQGMSDGRKSGAERRVVQFEEEEEDGGGGDGGGKGKGKEKEKEAGGEGEGEGAKPVREIGMRRDERWGFGGQMWEKKRLVSLFFDVGDWYVGC